MRVLFFRIDVLFKSSSRLACARPGTVHQGRKIGLIVRASSPHVF
jgi:hypothetical protein